MSHIISSTDRHAKTTEQTGRHHQRQRGPNLPSIFRQVRKLVRYVINRARLQHFRVSQRVVLLMTRCRTLLFFSCVSIPAQSFDHHVSRLVDEEDMCILPCVYFSHNLNFLLGGFQFQLLIFICLLSLKNVTNKYYWH